MKRNMDSSCNISINNKRSKKHKMNYINTTQRNNPTVQFESQNQHSAGSPEEAQSDSISLPHLGETS